MGWGCVRGGSAPSSVVGAVGAKAGGLGVDRAGRDAPCADPQPDVLLTRIKPLAHPERDDAAVDQALRERGRRQQLHAVRVAEEPLEVDEDARADGADLLEAHRGRRRRRGCAARRRPGNASTSARVVVADVARAGRRRRPTRAARRRRGPARSSSRLVSRRQRATSTVGVAAPRPRRPRARPRSARANAASSSPWVSRCAPHSIGRRGTRRLEQRGARRRRPAAVERPERAVTAGEVAALIGPSARVERRPRALPPASGQHGRLLRQPDQDVREHVRGDVRQRQVHAVGSRGELRRPQLRRDPARRWLASITTTETPARRSARRLRRAHRRAASPPCRSGTFGSAVGDDDHDRARVRALRPPPAAGAGRATCSACASGVRPLRGMSRSALARRAAGSTSAAARRSPRGTPRRNATSETRSPPAGRVLEQPEDEPLHLLDEPRRRAASSCCRRRSRPRTGRGARAPCGARPRASTTTAPPRAPGPDAAAARSVASTATSASPGAREPVARVLARAAARRATGRGGRSRRARAVASARRPRDTRSTSDVDARRSPGSRRGLYGGVDAGARRARRFFSAPPPTSSTSSRIRRRSRSSIPALASNGSTGTRCAERQRVRRRGRRRRSTVGAPGERGERLRALEDRHVGAVAHEPRLRTTSCAIAS